jgi:hypothetical protein
MNDWKASASDQAISIVRMSYSAGFEQKVLLRADAHHDNPKSLWDMERRHLDEALRVNAPIIDAGDLFCAMQGKYDPRADKADLRPEHRGPNYLYSLVKTAAEFYEPYAQNFVQIGYGNHEVSIAKRTEFPLTEALCDSLGVQQGGYRGLVRFVFEHESGGRVRQHELFYDHGNGGGGQASKGLHKWRDRALMVPDASVVLSGHIHEATYHEAIRWHVDGRGKLTRSTQYHVQTPTYKDEFGKIGQGWVDTKGMPPKPLGAWWMTFYAEGGEIKIKFERAT